MLLRVTEVQALPDYRLHLVFSDGTDREVDLPEELWGVMFEPLRDPEFFAQVRVDGESRTVVWPNGLGLDPEVLHGDFEPADSERPSVDTGVD